MKRIGEVVSDDQVKRKEATGLTWGQIIELGIRMAETKDGDLVRAKKNYCRDSRSELVA